MLQTWLTLSGKALLFLIGAQLSIAAFFLLLAYVEYAHNTQHLGVGLHHILIGDRFTNVGAAFCVLYPVPVLCSFGSAHAIRPFNDTESNPMSPGRCGCFVDALVGQQIFFGQLGYALPPRETTIGFIASSALISAASRAARDAATSERQSEVYTEIAHTLDRVDAALDAARRAVSKVVSDAEFAVYRAQFAHQVAISALKVANFVHAWFPSVLDSVDIMDTTLRRLIEYLVPATIVSTAAISKDAELALDALDTLLDAYSSFSERRLAIRHCALSSSSSSSVCLAVEILFRKLSMVAFMRDAVVTLKEMVDECREALDGYLICATDSQRCTLDVAFQILVSSQPYLVEPGRRTAILQSQSAST